MANNCFLKDLLKEYFYIRMKYVLESENGKEEMKNDIKKFEDNLKNVIVKNKKKEVDNCFEKLIKDIEEKKLSEIDTQVIFVEPILWVAGYDIFDPNIVKRASRDPKSKSPFDISVFKGENIFLPIEVKKVSESLLKIENNGKKTLKKEYPIKSWKYKKGALVTKECGTIKNFKPEEIQGKTGDLIIYEEGNEHYFDNFHEDGVGQLLSYTFNYLIGKGCLNVEVKNEENITKIEISKKNTFVPTIYPILTNGEYFIFFKITNEIIEELSSLNLTINSSNGKAQKQGELMSGSLNSDTDENTSNGNISEPGQSESTNKNSTNNNSNSDWKLTGINYKVYSIKDKFDDLIQALENPASIFPNKALENPENINCNSIDVQIWLYTEKTP